ncbi:imidazole glycerol phosphate synthase subunit HisH [Malaciobacter mytili]|uniref:imidazole glycerol phosphate synthase subunit HisH n=1 Tax=Malaciobacter mytili TaxID=603050 RepID=UPI0013E97D29|nr:imidazole glycerol phosphate synthase subunit HisH [Malaciobacter mytili]
MNKISILDYGLGNIHSIEKSILKLGYNSIVIDNEKDLLDSTHLILPGVGSFEHAMEILKEKKLDIAIKKYVQQGKPILGICLGMQLLFESSEENGFHLGLSILKGKVVAFKKNKDYTVPQVQWNKVLCNGYLFNDIKQDSFFYFLHSYYVDTKNEDYIVSFSKYNNIDYVSAIEYKNIFAVQFHPEKSSETGLKLIENFIRR